MYAQVWVGMTLGTAEVVFYQSQSPSYETRFLLESRVYPLG